jgi:rubrerythrin
MPYIQAPWPDEFVDQLNENQHNGKYPPYVCDKCEGVMIATKDGWICPKCNHKQDWMIT